MLRINLLSQKVPKDFTAVQQQTLLEWMHQATYVETEAGLHDFINHMQKTISIEHAMLSLGRVNSRQQLYRLEKLFNVSYPKEWISQYQTENYARHDPIMRMPLDAGPVHWKERFAKVRGRQERLFVEKVAQAGLQNGISFGSVSSYSMLGCIFSVAGRSVDKDPSIIRMLDCLVPHLYQAATRIVRLPPVAPKILPLSRREYDVFHWMSQGKSNWEISLVLGISLCTVKFHVASIIRKLNANNRSHAMVIGRILQEQEQPLG